MKKPVMSNPSFRYKTASSEKREKQPITPLETENKDIIPLQTPEVSKSKIEGLKTHYGVTEAQALQFFTVHMEADKWHSAECENLIENLSVDEKQRATAGAVAGAKLLWGFLDGIVAHAC